MDMRIALALILSLPLTFTLAQGDYLAPFAESGRDYATLTRGPLSNLSSLLVSVEDVIARGSKTGFENWLIDCPSRLENTKFATINLDARRAQYEAWLKTRLAGLPLNTFEQAARNALSRVSIAAESSVAYAVGATAGYCAAKTLTDLRIGDVGRDRALVTFFVGQLDTAVISLQAALEGH